MNVGSLFAGIGGFDLAFERASFDVVWQAEIDEGCRRVLDRRFAGVERFGDARGLVDPPRVDVLCGGWPCQPVSVAGKRGASDDERDMWPDFAYFAEILRPAWVVGENVPGALSAERGRYWRRVVDDLTQLGYGVVWRTLDAQHFGLAQRRKRVFVVGCLGDLERAAAVLLEPDSGGGDPAESDPSRAIAAGELARSLGGVGGGQDFGANKGTLVTAPTLESGENRTGGTRPPESLVVGYRKAQKAHDPDDCERWEEAEQASTLNTQGDTGGNVVAFNIYPEHGSTDRATLGHDVVRPSERGTRLADDVGVRRLTPTECERLQGFPDDWTDVGGASDSVRYRQLGNAVPVPVVEWIARRLASVAETPDRR